MTNVIRYCRRSSESGDNRNLHEQDAACRQYLESRNIPKSHNIRQQVTGTRHMRQRCARLWRYIERHRVTLLVVSSVDRLSRAELIDALMLIREINAHGCEVHSCDVGRLDPNDITTILRSWLSAEERKKIVDRMYANRKRKAAQGWVGAGPVPYGYTKHGQGREARLEINADEAPIIRRMFAEYNARGTLRGLAVSLNADRIPSPAGAAWTIPSVCKILTRKLYAGVTSWGGVESMHDDLSIITMHDYEIAQARMSRNKLESRRNMRRDYMLYNHIYCECGRRMQCRADGERVRYVCSDVRLPGSGTRCRNSVMAYKVDEAVKAYLRQVVTDEFLAAGIAEKERQEREAVASAPSRISALDAEIDRQRKRRRRLVSAFADGDDDAQAAINEADNAIRQMERERAELHSAEQAARDRRVVRESIAAHVRRLRDLLVDPSPELLRELVEILDVKARITNTDAGKAARLSCSVGDDLVTHLV